MIMTCLSHICLVYTRRDCISITAYYAQSGNTSWPELVEEPPAISEQFLQYLNCLGWPVSIYKGLLCSNQTTYNS